jgi:hypothetical protein
MTEETKKSLDELFPGWTPEAIEDSEGLDFDKPIKGKYVVRIISLDRVAGEKNGRAFDFVGLKTEAVEDVDGDPSHNRRLEKTYGCLDQTVEYGEGKSFDVVAEDELKKLLNDLFTADLVRGLSLTKGGFDGLLECADQLVDKTMNVTCWASKKGKQIVKVVKEHKGKKEESSDSIAWDD